MSEKEHQLSVKIEGVFWQPYFWKRVTDGACKSAFLLLAWILPLNAYLSGYDPTVGAVVITMIAFVGVMIFPNFWLEKRRVMTAVEKVSVNHVALDVCKQLSEFDFSKLGPEDSRNQLIQIQVLCNIALECNPDGSKVT